MVDWGLADRVAAAVGGSGGRAPGDAAAFGQRAVESACAAVIPAVTDYSRLGRSGELPRPEAVDRAEWSGAALATLRELSTELERQLAEGLAVRGTLGTVVRGVAGAAAGAEAGVAVGYAARKVLGQYDIALVGKPRQARLMFVTPNLAVAHAQLGEPAPTFLAWIAAHETTHALQFTAVPWLRDHLAGLLEELIRGASVRLEAGAVAGAAKRLLTSDPRRTVRAALRGELPGILLGGNGTVVFDRIQATMAVIEGHAEHVMDAALGDQPELSRLRDRLEARRASRSGIGDVIARLLGLDMKMRQYQLGKAFCDSVVAEAGIDGLNRVWQDPGCLPDLGELQHPAEWLARLVEPAAA